MFYPGFTDQTDRQRFVVRSKDSLDYSREFSGDGTSLPARSIGVQHGVDAWPVGPAFLDWQRKSR